MRRLRASAVRGCGLAAPGVPHHVAACAVPPLLDAMFRLPLAAVERLAREVWLASGSAAHRPGDNLSGKVLADVFSRICGPVAEGGVEAARGSGAAFQAGFAALDITWTAPHLLRDGDAVIDLTRQAPDLLRRLLARSWATKRANAAKEALISRQTALEGRRECLTRFLGPLNFEFIMDQLAPGKLPPSSARMLLAAM